MDEEFIVELHKYPNVRVYFSRMSVKDILLLVENQTYILTLFFKLCLDDLGNVSFKYTAVILQKFAEELAKRMGDLPQTHELFKRE